ncbi:uncharacterized protein [Nicotiana sylvestris]|uniref:uncharacterized protein n=1 Tax=Nicotiana sylvestris TaxID=4096 RepID=UPI00388CD171
MAIDQDVKEFLIMEVSDLIIQQAQGEWETRDVKFIPYRQHVEDLSRRFNQWCCRSTKKEHQEDFEKDDPKFQAIAWKVVVCAIGILHYSVHISRSNLYLLVYGTEVVIPAEVQIPSLRIIVETEIEDSEWVKTCLEQLTLIDEKRMAAIYQGQLYQQTMAPAYNKKVRPKNFEVGQLVLRCIILNHQEAKGKFAPNWKGPYIIRKLLPKGKLYLGDIEGNDPETTVNADIVKRYYV